MYLTFAKADRLDMMLLTSFLTTPDGRHFEGKRRKEGEKTGIRERKEKESGYVERLECTGRLCKGVISARR